MLPLLSNAHPLTTLLPMAKQPTSPAPVTTGGSAKCPPLVHTRVIYCGDNLEQLKKLPDVCVDLIYIDPPLNSNRNYDVRWGETKEMNL